MSFIIKSFVDYSKHLRVSARTSQAKASRAVKLPFKSNFLILPTMGGNTCPFGIYTNGHSRLKRLHKHAPFPTEAFLNCSLRRNSDQH